MTAGRSVTVGPIRMCVALAVLSLLPMNVVDLKAATTLEIRLAEDQPAATLVEAAVAHSNRRIYLHREAVITNEDVIDARVVPSGADFNVDISFSQEGAERMANATQGHVGKPLAILINGNVVAAPTLRAVIHQSALITGDYTKEQADEIAAGLTGR